MDGPVDPLLLCRSVSPNQSICVASDQRRSPLATTSTQPLPPPLIRAPAIRAPASAMPAWLDRMKVGLGLQEEEQGTQSLLSQLDEATTLNRQACRWLSCRAPQAGAQQGLHSLQAARLLPV